MSFEFIVTIDDVLQMRGGLTQATSYVISRYGSLDGGIDAGARILPEWLPNPPKLSGNTGSRALTNWPFRHPVNLGSGLGTTARLSAAAAK